MTRAEMEKAVIGCIGVYLLRESRDASLESGWLDADTSPGSYQVKVTSDTKLTEELGIGVWDLRALMKSLSEELNREIYLDPEEVFEDEKDITIKELVDAIYMSASY